MRTYFDKELLQQSSIFELRNIARDIGVYSPTTYKKEELIEKIFQIVNGEVKPYVPKSKQGRPPKSLSNPSRKTVLDMILPTEETTYSMEESQMPCLSESVRVFLEDGNAKTKTNFDIEGILEITNFGYGFVREKGKAYSVFSGAYVSSVLIEQNHLKSGDYIKGRAKLLEEDKPLVLFEIISVNGGKISQDFEMLPAIQALTRLDTNNEIDNFIVGVSNLIIQDKESESTAFDYIKSLPASYKTIVVKLDANKEQELIQNKLEVENYYTTMLQKANEHISIIKLALLRTKALAALGENVVLCIDSIDKAIKNQNTINGSSLLDIKSNTFDIVRLLSMSARQLENNGSVTIVCLYNYKNGNNFDMQVSAELEDYFSKIYKVKKQG